MVYSRLMGQVIASDLNAISAAVRSVRRLRQEAGNDFDEHGCEPCQATRAPGRVDTYRVFLRADGGSISSSVCEAASATLHVESPSTYSA